MKIYSVGGSVRDHLLGLKVQERDWVVVGATPADLLEKGFQQVGKDFPVFLHPKTKEEYALARTERKIGKGYYGFECHSDPSVTLEADLQRRDLTINAIAQSPNGEMIDPFNGQADLKHKILRHVSPAFSEDPVRILRVARFATRFANLGFTIATETKALMRKMVQNGEIKALVPERVWKECDRALGEKKPSVFFEVLRDCTALAYLFPSLDKLWGIPQTKQWHPEIDTGIHVMMALDQSATLSNDRKVRFATLCHDLGKGETPKAQWPSHKGHEARGVPIIQALCQQYRIPNHYRDLATRVSKFHLHAHRIFELKAKTILKLLEALDAFRKPQCLESFLLACIADARGRKGAADATYPQADFIREAFKQANTIQAQPFLKQGFKGVSLGQKIRHARIEVIKQLINNTSEK